MSKTDEISPLKEPEKDTSNRNKDIPGAVAASEDPLETKDGPHADNELRDALAAATQTDDSLDPDLNTRNTQLGLEKPNESAGDLGRTTSQSSTTWWIVVSKEGLPAPHEPPPTNVESPEFCKICFEKPIETVLVPCGHACMCTSCASAAVSFVDRGDDISQERGQPVREPGMVESILGEVVRSFGVGWRGRCPICRSGVREVVRMYRV